MQTHLCLVESLKDDALRLATKSFYNYVSFNTASSGGEIKNIEQFELMHILPSTKLIDLLHFKIINDRSHY